MKEFWARIALAAAVVVAVGIAFTFESPWTVTRQQGFRGIGMEQVYNQVSLATKAAATTFPEPIDPVEPAGVKSSEAYQNVQVLGDVDSNEFIRLMTAITAWVSPEQGCAYCHAEGEELSADTLYTKRVARRMIQMTRHINVDWKAHVGGTGVNCYTCHRGQPVPQNIWFREPQNPQTPRLVGDDGGQNKPAASVGLASLPYDPFTPYFQSDPEGIRVASLSELPNGNRRSIKQTEHTYGLMMHMSNSLGVNCTFCHNSRAFYDWNQSPPQRTTSWHGLRMVNDLAVNYLDPLRTEYPLTRLSLEGDAPKANCATCHQGVNKPLYGRSMIEGWPELASLPPAPADPAVPAPPAAGQK